MRRWFGAAVSSVRSRQEGSDHCRRLIAGRCGCASAAPGLAFAGLLAGTLTGHALVTALAVGSGRWIGDRVDERLLYRLSGGLFLLFGLMALHQALG